MYKVCIFSVNRARDTPLRGVYIPHFDQISVKFQFCGPYTFIVAPLHPRSRPPCQISPSSVQRVANAGRKPQNRPLSNLNNRRFALRAMLPVNKTFTKMSQVFAILNLSDDVTMHIRLVDSNTVSTMTTTRLQGNFLASHRHP